MSNMNFNKVILGGRLTADVELKATPSGDYVATFFVAVNRKASKDVEPKADFINCVAWRNTAEFVSRYFKKGSSILVVGTIRNRSWTDGNGNKRYATDVVVDEVHFVDAKSDGGSAKSDGGAEGTPEFYDATQLEEIPNDADIPF